MLIPALHIKCDFMDIPSTHRHCLWFRFAPLWGFWEGRHEMWASLDDSTFCFGFLQNLLNFSIPPFEESAGDVKKRKFLRRWNSILISNLLFMIIAVDGNGNFLLKPKHFRRFSPVERVEWLIAFKDLIRFPYSDLKLPSVRGLIRKPSSLSICC